MTIEHDPDAISRRKVSFPIAANALPLTTTASDTNIPNAKLQGLSETYGSKIDLCNSIDNLKNKSNPDIAEAAVVSNAVCTKPKQGTLARTGDKERLFKRRDEGYMSGTRSRQLRRKNNLSDNRQSLDKERSSSMSRLLDE